MTLYPKVLVLLPTYNGSRFVEKQIDSILNQSDVNVEILIYDDSSCDNTPDILSSYSDVRISLLPNLKKISTTNSAAVSFYSLILSIPDRKDYAFVALADQDDIWLRTKLSRSIFSLRKHNASAYSSSVLAFWSSGRIQHIRKHRKASAFNSIYESAGPGCTYVLSRELIQQFKSHIQAHLQDYMKLAFHDWSIYAFAMNNGFNWFIDPSSTLLYRQHQSNSFGSRSSLPQLLKRASLISSGWYLSQVLTFLSFYRPDQYSSDLRLPFFLLKVKHAFLSFFARSAFWDKISLPIFILSSSRYAR